MTASEITAADEARLAKIAYRLHLTRKFECTCGADDCDQCTVQFLMDAFKRLAREHNHLRKRAGFTLICERLL